ncbi:ATP-grasp domain-containing protein [Clostridiaceae bacterium HSG29]|nr:ATP-grasp domain-containing protein [Clostridiaceae bacterium HSG29]
MNYVFISPYFPTNYYNFCKGLKEAGVTVLGIGEENYDSLRTELKESLTEYYRVDNMEDYSQLVKACGYFTHKYGKIDRIESNNEYWLEKDAQLRTDFNVFGLKNDAISDMKFKSKMKEVFRSAGLNVARGKVVHTLDDARAFIAEVDYPVVAKPDNGVGASNTYRLNNEKELQTFFDNKTDQEYIMEEYIEGEIQTFDGLVDSDGKVVFHSSLIFKTGLMETVNGGLDVFYYIPKELPKDIVEAGIKTLEAFGLKERFFHFEYFKMKDGKVVALEVNIRPPGGLTVDMFNYANDIDIYKEYGKVVAYKTFDAHISREYNCFYIGRKNFINYKYSLEDILEKYNEYIIFHEPISAVLAPAIGDYGIVLRSRELEIGEAIVRFALEKA